MICKSWQPDVSTFIIGNNKFKVVPPSMFMSWGPSEGFSLTKSALISTRQDVIIYVSKFGLWSCTSTFHDIQHSYQYKKKIYSLQHCIRRHGSYGVSKIHKQTLKSQNRQFGGFGKGMQAFPFSYNNSQVSITSQIHKGKIYVDLVSTPLINQSF